MRARFVFASLLLAVTAVAEKPWETRVDLPLAVPLELPRIPPTNPFSTTLTAAPSPRATPMLEKVPVVMTVAASAYIDRTGACRRAVVTGVPLTGLAAEVQESLLGTDFSPGTALGVKQPTWIPVEVDLAGRIKEGRILRLAPELPDPDTTPQVEVSTAPVASASDLALPAVAIDGLDVLPAPKRFRASVRGSTIREGLRLLVEVGADGRCSRVVFLRCPDGLRAWVLGSLAGWSFAPGQDEKGPVVAWLVLDGDVEVELSSLSAGGLRLLRESSYPVSGGAPAGGHPPVS